MYYEDCIPESIDTVLTWDIPEEYLANAISGKARLLAGEYSDDIWVHEPEDPYTLRHHTS